MYLQELHLLTLVAMAALLLRLYREGLHLRYRTFFWTLALELAGTLALYPLNPRLTLYGQIYFVTTAINWTMRFLVLRELCLHVFQDHPGIRAAVRIGIWISSVLAVLLPLGMLASGMSKAQASSSPYLDLFFLIDQTVTFFLTVLFAGTIAFVTWFPVALRRNIVLFCLGFGIKFIGEGGLLLLRNLAASKVWETRANTANMLLGLAVTVLWLIWLSRAGEKPLVSVSELLRPGQGDDTLQLLNRINAFLTRVLPKKPGDKQDFRE